MHLGRWPVWVGKLPQQPEALLARVSFRVRVMVSFRVRLRLRLRLRLSLRLRG